VLERRLFRLWHRFRGDPSARGAPLTRAELIAKARPIERRLFALGERHLNAANAEVRNLAQVKVGDTVTVSYLGELSFQVMRPGSGATPGVTIAQDAVRAEPGQQPGAPERAWSPSPRRSRRSTRRRAP
jgi:hypothetical protein